MSYLFQPKIWSSRPARLTRFKLVSVTLWAFMLMMFACGGQPKQKAKTIAEGVYLQGVEALEDEDFITAAERFRTVKTKYLFSPFAALAELRLGDAALAQGHNYEAIETYRMFIQTRPQHAEVPSAYWKIGVAYTADRPSKVFLLPPSFERDRSSTKDALRALQNYLKRYPKHKKASEAQKLVTECRQDLAAYELYVARFYRDREKWTAARGRYEQLITQFKDIKELWREGAEELIEVYQALELAQEASLLEKKLKQSIQ